MAESAASSSSPFQRDNRSSRSMSKISWNPQDRGRSLISMRTYYAFGARSTSITPLSSRSSSVVPSSIPAHYNPPGYSHRSVVRSPSSSYSTPFVRNVPHRMTISSFSSERPQSSISYSRSNHCSTPVHSSYQSRLVSPPRVSSPLFTSSSPLFTPSRTPSRLADTSSRLSRRDMSPTSHAVESTHSPVPTPTPPPPVPTINTSLNDDLKRQHEEMEELRRKNKQLEEEIAKLTLQVKDGDRSSRELKRMLLESEAETKVWRSKAEQAPPPPQIIEVVKSNDGLGLDETLYDKLENTADKLSKLNAVHDLKMLQSHIESALTEISSK